MELEGQHPELNANGKALVPKRRLAWHISNRVTHANTECGMSLLWRFLPHTLSTPGVTP